MAADVNRVIFTAAMAFVTLVDKDIAESSFTDQTFRLL
jgi:hypothetical protein